MRMDFFRRIAHIAMVGVALAFGAARTANADVTLGNSVGDGVIVSLTFTPIIGSPLTVSAGPVVSAFGGAPAPYSVTSSALAFSVPLLNIHSLTADAASNVDGLPGVRFADADATINTLSLGPPLPGLPPIITLALTSVTATANVTGDFPVLTPTGSTTLSGAVLSIPILGIAPIVLATSPAPNTQVGLPGLGVSVLLNEQILTGNGVTSQKIEVNAIDIALNIPIFAPTFPSLPLGTLTGNIIVDRTEATLVATASTPEPPSSILALLGGCILMLWRWRHSLRHRSPTTGLAR